MTLAEIKKARKALAEIEGIELPEINEQKYQEWLDNNQEESQPKEEVKAMTINKMNHEEFGILVCVVMVIVGKFVYDELNYFYSWMKPLTIQGYDYCKPYVIQAANEAKEKAAQSAVKAITTVKNKVNELKGASVN
jgi:hypothetical protein